MRRTLTILTFSLAAAVAVAGCGSSEDTSTSSASSTTAKGNTTTTANAAQAKANGPKCRALATYQYAELIAVKAVDKDQAEKDRTIAGLDKAATNLKAKEKNLSEEVDLRVAWIKKTLAGQPVPEAEKTAADKAKNQMNLYRSQNCPKTDSSGKGGSTSTTKAATPTTTAKK